MVASTASEVVRFLNALAAGELVTAASWQEMNEGVEVPGASEPWVEPRYGLGLMIDEASPWGLLVGHGGEGPGTMGIAVHLPKKRATVCLLINAEEQAKTHELEWRLLRDLAG